MMKVTFQQSTNEPADIYLMLGEGAERAQRGGYSDGWSRMAPLEVTFG